MKFRVERDVLADAVAWVVRGLSNRPPVPVLAGVLVKADREGTLTLSAFDYEVSAKVTVEADVEEAGEVLVHGRLLSEISRALPHRPVTVELDGAKVQLTCGSSRFALTQMPVGDYPTLPQSPEVSGAVAGDVFTQAVAQCAIAADRGDTLPILTGVLVQVEGERMTLLACDRYRLAQRVMTWQPTATDASFSALIPARTLSETAKSLGTGGTIQLAIGDLQRGEGLVGFEAGARTTTSRLLDGEYPKVTALFPKSVETTAVVSTAELVEAVKRVALVAERNTAIRLNFSEGQVAIEAGSGEDASAAEAIECRLTGPEIQTAFNPQFFLEGLQALGAKFARLQFTQGNKPAVLTGQAEAESDLDDAYQYVLMPVRFPS